MKKKQVFELPEKLFGLDTALMIIFVRPIGLILLLVIVFNLVVLPRVDDIQSSFKVITDLDLKTKGYRQKINYLKSIDQDSLKRDEILVTNALMPERNSFFLVNVVKKIADRYGFSVDSFAVNLGTVDSTAKPADSLEKGYASIPAKMVLIGPSSSYNDLAFGLERSLPLITIRTFELKTTSGVATIDLQIDGFYISDKKLVEAEKLSLADLTLKQDETELVSQLNQYQVLENIDSVDGSFSKQKNFVKYDRKDPFSQ